MNDNELMHYGVLGMKWGHRKALPTSSTLNKVNRAKAAKIKANKQYRKDYNSAYGYSSSHRLRQFINKKAKAESDKRWDKAMKSADEYKKANDKYKQAKSERKTMIKDQTKKLNKKASFGEKLLYNNATRKKAAKYVVDNNMTVAEATKKAKGVAWRNTALFVAAYGATIASTLYRANK